MIESEAEEIDRFHRNVHATYKERGKNLRAWKDACSAFHGARKRRASIMLDYEIEFRT